MRLDILLLGDENIEYENNKDKKFEIIEDENRNIFG